MIALYRKYRPKIFAEVVGQTSAKQTLQNALKSDRIVHSYLFSGPRGTGKTTVARIFAKALNCQQRTHGEAEPCNTCPTCIAIDSNSFIDLVEIDAASNRGIDEIRNLKESVRFAPSQKNGYKVYIIDESHMLTKDASNALLKTLEEPPRNVVFILATTDPHKMLPTIHSRVQQFDFTSLSAAELREKLERIIQTEQITVAPEVINRIVLGAMGGARDAESILGKLLSYADQEISLEVAEQVLGKDATGASMEILTAIGSDNAIHAIQTLHALYTDGYNLESVAARLIERSRAVFLASISPQLISPKDYLPEEIEVLTTISSQQESQVWGNLVSRLEHRRPEIATAYIPVIPLELAIVESCITKTSLELSLSEIPAAPATQTISHSTSHQSLTQEQTPSTKKPSTSTKPKPPLTPPSSTPPSSNPFRSTQAHPEPQATPVTDPAPKSELSTPSQELDNFQSNDSESPTPESHPESSSHSPELDLYQVKQAVDPVARLLAKESKSLVPLFTKSKILKVQSGKIYMESQSAFFKSRLEKNAQIIASAFETILSTTPIVIEVVAPGTMKADPVTIPESERKTVQAPTPKPKEQVIPNLPDEPVKSVEDSVSDIFKEFM